MAVTYRSVAISSLCINALLILALVLAGKALIGLYERALEAQFPVVPSISGPANSTIVFLGDSRVHQWGKVDGVGARYVSFAGATSSQIVAAVKSDLVELRGATDVYLQLGVNDLRLIGLQSKRAEEIGLATQKRIDELASYLAAKNLRVTIITVFPTGPLRWVRRPVWSDEVSATLRSLNDRLLRHSGQGAVRVLDVSEVFAALGSAAFTDELHVSRRTYRELNQYLISNR